MMVSVIERKNEKSEITQPSTDGAGLASPLTLLNPITDEQRAIDAYLAGLYEGKRLVQEADRRTRLAHRKGDIVPAEIDHQRIASVLEQVYRRLGFDSTIGRSVFRTAYERTYRNGALTGLYRRTAQGLGELSPSTIALYFDQTQLHHEISRWATDSEDSPLSYSVAVPILPWCPLVVFELASHKARGKDRYEWRRKWLDQGLEKLTRLLSGDDPEVTFYAEKTLAGTRARLFAILPNVPDSNALRAFANRVALGTNVYINAVCGRSTTMVGLPFSHIYSIAGRYAPESTGRSPLNGREQSGVDGSVASIEDVFAILIESAEHPVPWSVAKSLVDRPWGRPEPIRTTDTSQSPPCTSLRGLPPVAQSAEEGRAAPANTFVTMPGAGSNSTTDIPSSRQCQKAPSISSHTRQMLYDLGLDLRPGKRKNMRVLPVRPEAERTKADSIVPSPVGMYWAQSIGDHRPLVTNALAKRDPSAEARALDLVLRKIVVQVEATSNYVVGCDNLGLIWSLSGLIFPGSGILYIELDDHDMSLSTEERIDRQRRFLAALAALLGPDRFVATKHHSIADTVRRGAFGVHTWSYFDYDAEKPALARLRADVAKRAGIPETCVECHSGIEGGMTRFVLDPEYSTLTSAGRRIERTIEAVHEEICRLRALGLILPRRYADPVPGEPIRKTSGTTGTSRKAAPATGVDPVSRFSYGAGERYRAFFRIAGRAGAVASNEREAGDLAWDLAIKCDRGSRDMADPTQRATLERDIQQLATRSFHRYGGRRPEGGARSFTRDATGASESYEKDGFVLPEVTSSEEDALRGRVMRLAGHLLPIRPSYREAALDSIVHGYRYLVSRYLQDKDRMYENEDLRRLDGFALMERRFFNALRCWGVENPLRCRDVLLAAGILVEAPPSPIDGRSFRWTGRLPHFGRHFRTRLPAEILEDSTGLPAPTEGSEYSRGTDAPSFDQSEDASIEIRWIDKDQESTVTRVWFEPWGSGYLHSRRAIGDKGQAIVGSRSRYRMTIYYIMIIIIIVRFLVLIMQYRCEAREEHVLPRGPPLFPLHAPCLASSI